MQAKIAVVGAGTMGNGIAQVFAAHGYDVRLADVSQAALDKGLAAVASSLARLVKKGQLAEADVPAILARIQTTTRLADLADRDLVVEAATENAAVKESIFRELAAVVRPDAVLASNTS